MKHNFENFIIIKGKEKDLDELEILYNDTNDFLNSNVNYPGWQRGIYPVRETANTDINERNLFVAKIDNKICGSIILNHKPENAYDKVKWGLDIEYDEVIVIHTFVVHPKYLKNGIGKKLMDFARLYSKENGMKTIRLDVSIYNKPAILLYEKCGYDYVGTVDLGLSNPDLKWFKLYEFIL
jgi:ribosomal protein S18 acetylase RimI-like enzyme